MSSSKVRKKKVLAHWVEMRTYEFPFDAPVDDEEELHQWILTHPIAQGEWEHFETKSDTRDWEIVSVEDIEREAGNKVFCPACGMKFYGKLGKTCSKSCNQYMLETFYEEGF